MAVLRESVGEDLYAQLPLDAVTLLTVDDDDAAYTTILTGLGDDLQYSTDGTLYNAIQNVADAARHVGENIGY